jgi:hypothetical protein
MIRTYAPLIALAAITLAGCGGTSAATMAAAKSPRPATVPAKPSPSAAPCLTRSCLTGDAQRVLIGVSAKDGAAITKATCTPSTLKRNPR